MEWRGKCRGCSSRNCTQGPCWRSGSALGPLRDLSTYCSHRPPNSITQHWQLWCRLWEGTAEFRAKIRQGFGMKLTQQQRRGRHGRSRSRMARLCYGSKSWHLRSCSQQGWKGTRTGQQSWVWPGQSQGCKPHVHPTAASPGAAAWPHRASPTHSPSPQPQGCTQQLCIAHWVPALGSSDPAPHTTASGLHRKQQPLSHPLSPFTWQVPPLHATAEHCTGAAIPAGPRPQLSTLAAAGTPQGLLPYG